MDQLDSLSANNDRGVEATGLRAQLLPVPKVSFKKKKRRRGERDFWGEWIIERKTFVKSPTWSEKKW